MDDKTSNNRRGDQRLMGKLSPNNATTSSSGFTQAPNVAPGSAPDLTQAPNREAVGGGPNVAPGLAPGPTQAPNRAAVGGPPNVTPGLAPGPTQAPNRGAVGGPNVAFGPDQRPNRMALDKPNLGPADNQVRSSAALGGVGTNSYSSPGGTRARAEVDNFNLAPEKIKIVAVISLCISFFIENIRNLFILALIGNIPNFILNSMVMVFNDNILNYSMSLIIVFIIAFICLFIFVSAIYASIGYYVSQVDGGYDSEIFECIKYGIKKIITIFSINFITFLICIGLLFISLLFIKIFIQIFSISYWFSIPISLLIIVPIFIYILTKISLGVPCGAIEDVGGLEALKRSYNLSRGNALRMFLVYLVTLLCGLPFFLLLGGIDYFSNQDISNLAKIVLAILYQLIVCIPVSFYMTVQAIVFLEVRKIKEDDSIVSQAAIFE
jgi:hypothetical protein